MAARGERTVPFLDLRITDGAVRSELLEAIEAVFRHGRFILGPEVEALEQKVAAYCGRRVAVGVGSGTDALLLALKGLGIGPGDEVITTALSWIATANAIAVAGATPVFADIGDDLNIDPSRAADLITPRTKAIVPVHYTGKVCDMAQLMRLADEHGLDVIEDAAQAFGAMRDGRRAGSFGRAACFSMNPMKVFGACGEAGIVVTDDEALHRRLLALRYNGMVDKDECGEPGLNGRIDTLQAAILLRRLPDAERIIERRRYLAERYSDRLAGVVETPRQAAEEYDVFYTYTIRTERRDELSAFLESKGIEAKVRDRYLMPEQPAYRDTARGSYPNARRLVGRLLSLPLHEKMTEADVDYVAESVQTFFGDSG